MSPAGKSLWNFVIHLNNRKNLFWKIGDFSNESHTAEFLAQKIQVILDDISVQKFASVITDAISNVHATQNLITEKFLYILNVRCIAYLLNLITKDLTFRIFLRYSRICFFVFFNSVINRIIVLEGILN